MIDGSARQRCGPGPTTVQRFLGEARIGQQLIDGDGAFVDDCQVALRVDEKTGWQRQRSTLSC